jgi:hypothetical protein
MSPPRFQLERIGEFSYLPESGLLLCHGLCQTEVKLTKKGLDTMATDATGAATQKAPMPPYIAFKTLIDVIERMERESPPTRVDPTYLDTYAGGYRPTVIGNLQTLGLLTKAGEPTSVLLDLVEADEATRKTLIAQLIRTSYPDVLALPSNSTQGQFLEIFTARGAQGDTRRKAVSFFLKASAYAGIQTGTHWKTPPASTSSSTRRRATKEKNGSETPDPSGETQNSTSLSGEIVTVDLGDAGRVVVAVDVKWLQLNDETFTSLRKAIQDLKSLAAANPPAPVTTLEATADDDAEGGES